MKTEKLIGLFKEFEYKEGYDCASIEIFSDESGSIKDGNSNEIYEFMSVEQLVNWLETENNQPLIEVDGVEYSESTVRSIIKKHTK